jgi:hypothetical protein
VSVHTVEKGFALFLPLLLAFVAFRFYLIDYIRRSDLARKEKIWWYVNCGIYIGFYVAEAGGVCNFFGGGIALGLVAASLLLLLLNMLVHAIWIG